MSHQPFASRIAMISLNRVRDDLPHSGPSFPALLAYLDELARWGYTAICLDAEALLPYRSAPDIAISTTWTRDQVAQLASRMDALGLEIIPFLQGLGHVYPVLEHARYANLRETSGMFQQFCPLNPDAGRLVMAMIDDVLALFPSAHRFHVGGDECRQLGECPRCREVAEKHGVGELFIRHFMPIIERLKSRKVRPILWHDMLAYSRTETSKQFAGKVQLAYWNYHPSKWPMPIDYLDRFIAEGFEDIIATPAIFWGPAWLAFPYGPTIEGIREMTIIARERGLKEMMAATFAKFAPWEFMDWGYFHAAARFTGASDVDEAIRRRYNLDRFGAESPDMTRLMERMAAPLPFAEYEHEYHRDRRNRFDLTGMSYHVGREQRYTLPDKIGEARRRISEARLRAEEVLDGAGTFEPEPWRGRRLARLLRFVARETLTRADAAEAALLDPENLPKGEEGIGLASRIEGLRLELVARASEKQELLSESSDPASVARLVQLHYREDELRHLRDLGESMCPGPFERGRNQAAIPILRMPGSPYERGVEHGRVAADLIRHQLDWWLPGKTDPSLMAGRDAQERYLFEHFPWMIEEMKGIARGAGLSYETVFWLNVFNAVVSGPGRAASAAPKGAEQIDAGLAECSTAILRRNGRIALMKTSDIDELQRRRLIGRLVDWNGMRTLCFGWAGTVWCELGLNSDGLVIGANSGPRRASQSGFGIPQHIAPYPLILSCRTVDEAEKFLARHPLSGKGVVLGCADVSGAASIFECSGGLLGARPMKGDMIAGTNHFLHPALTALNEGKSKAHMAESVGRLAAIEETLDSDKRGDASAVLRDCAGRADTVPPICKRMGEWKGEPRMFTLSAWVVEPLSRRVLLTGLSPSEDKWGRLQPFGV